MVEVSISAGSSAARALPTNQEAGARPG